jgi:hypothetical protein
MPLAPLTLIFGQNNAGKSSILQSLLLLRQSIAGSGNGPSLNLGGPLYAAGSFADIVHHHQSNQTIELVLEFSPPAEPERTIEVEFSAADPGPPRLDRLQIAGKGMSKVVIRRGPGSGGPFQLLLGGQSQGVQREANFSFRAGSFLPVFGEEPPHAGRPSARREETRQAANEAIDELVRLLSEMRAVGPFRSPPERRYEFTGAPAEEVDLAGRRVIDALVAEIYASQKKRRKPAPSLLEKVNDWLARLAGVKLEIQSLSQRQPLYEVQLLDVRTGRSANFADVGFGIGQALPLFVEGLRTPVGGLFLVQEPEIHLHPDAQLVMADFLIELAASGRQVIAETHSENILLRVRRSLLGTGPDGWNQEKVSLLHVGRSNRPAESRVKHLQLDALGQVEGWPAGFFEEASRGSSRTTMIASPRSSSSSGPISEGITRGRSKTGS